MGDGDEFHDANDFYDPYDFYDDGDVEDRSDPCMNKNEVESVQDTSEDQTSTQDCLYQLLEENSLSSNWLQEFLLEENESMYAQPDLNLDIPTQDWLTEFLHQLDQQQHEETDTNLNLLTSPPKKRRCQ